MSDEKETRVKRYIGIVPRVKKTKEGEARPTLVAIMSEPGMIELELESDRAEIDFVWGMHPVAWRPVTPEDNLASFQKHHIRYRKAGEGEDTSLWNPNHILRDSEGNPADPLMLANKVPTHFIGLAAGDRVGMMLGGSGNALANALTTRGERIGAEVYRIPPFAFKDYRDRHLTETSVDGTVTEIEGDNRLLAILVRTDVKSFYLTRTRDRKMLAVAKTLQNRIDAMKNRIAAEQRLNQRLRQEPYYRDLDTYPEGDLEAMYADRLDHDAILQGMKAVELAMEEDLYAAVEATHLYRVIHDEIKGFGPKIGSRLLGIILDIRRFRTPAQLKKYLGVDVRPIDDAHSEPWFPVRQSGVTANWQDEGRKALYLLVKEQFVRQTDTTEWGARFLKQKDEYKRRHPNIVLSYWDSEGVHQTLDVLEGAYSYSKKTKKCTITKSDGTTLEVRLGRLHPRSRTDKRANRLKYTKLAIHQTTIWRIASRFTVWLHRELWRHERRLNNDDIASTGESVNNKAV